MFMRITWGKVRPNSWSNLETVYHRVCDPNTPGLAARWLARDTVDSDAFFAVTLWETADAIHAWESKPEYRTEFLDKINPFTLGSYSVSVCEVKYQSVSDRLGSA
jgi:heme-degrading monooxygenase HmoA